MRLALVLGLLFFGWTVYSQEDAQCPDEQSFVDGVCVEVENADMAVTGEDVASSAAMEADDSSANTADDSDADSAGN